MCANICRYAINMLCSLSFSLSFSLSLFLSHSLSLALARTSLSHAYTITHTHTHTHTHTQIDTRTHAHTRTHSPHQTRQPKDSTPIIMTAFARILRTSSRNIDAQLVGRGPALRRIMPLAAVNVTRSCWKDHFKASCFRQRHQILL